MRARSSSVGFFVAALFAGALSGCTSLSQPQEIVVTKDAARAPVAGLGGPGPGAARPGAQPGAQPGAPQGAPAQPVAPQPPRPMRVGGPPANNAGSCGN